MSFQSQRSSRPLSKSSYTSQSSLHSNFEKRKQPARVVSNLKRSNELLSVENELRELLKNSTLDERQKAAFSAMLETTFDLFQAPLHKGNNQGSLIDSSSIELYSKMQSLVAALTSLIMNEEESTRLDITHSDNMVKEEEEDEDSTEFSDGDEIPQSPRLEPPSSRGFPKSSTISNFRSISRPQSMIGSSRRSSFLKASPTTRSPTIDTNYNHYQEIRQKPTNRFQETSPAIFKPSFQAIPTPIPRSFSGRPERPKSMFISHQDQSFSPMTSSRRSSRGFDPSELFHREFGSETGGDTSFGSGDGSRFRRGSIREPGSASKRYSMRF